MSAPARPATRQDELRVQQAVELLIACAREGFSGSVEVHFRAGQPMEARKTATIHFGPQRPDLMRGG